MANIPLEEKLNPEDAAQWRDKLKIQQGISKDMASEFGGKPKEYLKKFATPNRRKIRALQVGVAKGLEKRFPKVTTLKRPAVLANVPLRKAA